MAKTKTPCDCSKFSIKVSDDERQVTGCDRESGGKFAPGHDAKLKSLLIEAETRGLDVVKVDTVDGETTETVSDALSAADYYGFCALVEKGAANSKAKAEARAKAKAEKDAKKPQPGPARARVGRKEFDGEILDDRETFRYDDENGEETEVKETKKFRLV